MSAPTKLRIWYFLAVSVQIGISPIFPAFSTLQPFPSHCLGIQGKTKREMGFPYGLKNTPPTIRFK